MPVVGFLDARSTEALGAAARIAEGLKETGYLEGENSGSYHWLKIRRRLPELAADLVHRKVAVIVRRAGRRPGRPRPQARRSRSSSGVGEDPVRLGLVASFSRPGGNLTGINFFNDDVAAKRLELLRELCPAHPRSPCSSIRNPTSTETS